ncbi:MAG TPA: hypothetical protein VGP93_18580, partial [Polyangiaceae bacterium]|nr:hypothetical protein [Polyangiaceae bacterium]
GDWVFRELLFPMFYRYDRCSPDDVQVWTNFNNGVTPSADWRDHAEYDSLALHVHVMYSELWEDPSPDAALIEQRRAGARFWPGGVDRYAPGYDSWPRYPQDPFVGQWPEFSTPIMGLNGDLDALTPLANASTITTHLSGDSQHFFKVPFSAHAGAFWSLCTEQLLHQFFLHPNDALDASCLDQEQPPDLSGANYGEQYLGLSDAWDGTPGASVSATAPAGARPAHFDWQRLLADLRKRTLRARLIPGAPGEMQGQR